MGADQSRDIIDCRSVVSCIWTLNNTIIDWICKKHTSIALHSNHTEILTLFECVKKTIELRRRLLQLGFPQTGPTPIGEDNQPLLDEIT